jgi:hypothetical protein
LIKAERISPYDASLITTGWSVRANFDGLLTLTVMLCCAFVPAAMTSKADNIIFLILRDVCFSLYKGTQKEGKSRSFFTQINKNVQLLAIFLK